MFLAGSVSQPTVSAVPLVFASLCNCCGTALQGTIGFGHLRLRLPADRSHPDVCGLRVHARRRTLRPRLRTGSTCDIPF